MQFCKNTGWGNSVNAIAPFADGSEKFLVGLDDSAVMKYDNGFTQLQGQGWKSSITVMNSFIYNEDVKVAIGLADGAVMLYSEKDNVNGNNGIKQLQGPGWDKPVFSMINFNYQGDTKLVAGLGCKFHFAFGGGSNVCGAIEMYSMKEGQWKELHNQGWDRPILALKFFEYNNISYIVAGLGSKYGRGGGAVELYNMESGQWSQLGNQWSSRVLKLDVVGDYLLAGTANGAINSFPLSKIQQKEFGQSNWQAWILSQTGMNKDVGTNMGDSTNYKNCHYKHSSINYPHNQETPIYLLSYST